MIPDTKERLRRYETALWNLRVRREHLIETLGSRRMSPESSNMDFSAELLGILERAIKILEGDVHEVRNLHQIALAEEDKLG